MNVKEFYQELVTLKVDDRYGNSHFDLTKKETYQEKSLAKLFKEALPEVVKEVKGQKKHILSMHIANQHTRLAKYLLEAGFKCHHSDENSLFMIKCLDNNPAHECTYPKYKTVSVGVSGVVFNKSLDKFLAVQERLGPYLSWKAPTGTVDYEKNEEPKEAVIREIKEETGIDLAGAPLLSSFTWTKNFRGNQPDINLGFAFVIDENAQNIKKQDSEIAKAEWISVNDFIQTKHPNSTLPLVHARIVAVAHKAVLMKKDCPENKDCLDELVAWGSGKPVTLFSANL